uniref:Uncharacterized protein n=1 Tax=Caenorhabditis japonica TaxID=281687 RepID=A0A8R1J114_CAEJA
MKRELNHDAFKQSIWRANDMDPNPVQSSISLPTISKSAQFKFRRTLTNRNRSNATNIEEQIFVPSYKFSTEFQQLSIASGFNYSKSLQNSIRSILEEFDLNRTNTPNWKNDHSVYGENSSALKKTLGQSHLIRKFGRLMDSKGCALFQTTTPVFVLPDTKWAPRERRQIGVYDDLQWLLMSTFVDDSGIPSSSQNEKFQAKPLIGGWWYRRTVPRCQIVPIVKEMNIKRNVLEDCEL